MKKLFLSFVLSCFACVANAADIDFSEVVRTTKMPSDAEIMRVLSKCHFDEEQKKTLFVEIKKQLREIYSSDNPDEINNRLNSSLNEMKSGSYSDYIDDSVMNEFIKDLSDLPRVEK